MAQPIRALLSRKRNRKHTGFFKEPLKIERFFIVHIKDIAKPERER
jgi:hypothetical protein